MLSQEIMPNSTINVDYDGKELIIKKRNKFRAGGQGRPPLQFKTICCNFLLYKK